MKVQILGIVWGGVNDVIVSLVCLVIFGLAYGIIPGGDKLVWVRRPPRNKLVATFCFSAIIFFLIRGIVRLAH